MNSARPVVLVSNLLNRAMSTQRSTATQGLMVFQCVTLARVWIWVSDPCLEPEDL